MVTFTLPYELRALAWRYQTVIYNILFDCAASTLKDFGLNLSMATKTEPFLAKIIEPLFRVKLVIQFCF